MNKRDPCGPAVVACLVLLAFAGVGACSTRPDGDDDDDDDVTDDAGDALDDVGPDGGDADDAGVVDAGTTNGDAGGADAGNGQADGGAVLDDAGHVVVDAGDGSNEDDAGEPLLDAGAPLPDLTVCASGRIVVPADNAGALRDPELVETSGLATSWIHPGLLWAHNDSGDTARVFATGTDGSARGRIELPGVTATDVEDIAVAACPEAPASCVWWADTGDNARSRAQVQLVIFPEPEFGLSGIVGPSVDDTRVIPFTWQGGPVDVEAMAVDATGTHAYFFEKLDADSVRVFVLDAPFDGDAPMVARELTRFAPPGIALVSLGRAITAADLHTSGTRLLLRVYSGIFEVRFPAGRGIADIGSLTPTLLTLGPVSEPQGEALCYDEDGTGLYSVSEDRQAMPGQMLHHFRCQP